MNPDVKEVKESGRFRALSSTDEIGIKNSSPAHCKSLRNYEQPFHHFVPFD